MSKISYTVIAGAATAMVGIAAFAATNVQAPQSNVGTNPMTQQMPGGDSAASHNIDARAVATERANMEFVIRQQECDTLKYTDPQGHQQCHQQAQSARDQAMRVAESAQESFSEGQGDRGRSGTAGQGLAREGTSGKAEDDGAVDKVLDAVMEKLAALGIVSEEKHGRQAKDEKDQQARQPGSAPQGYTPSQSSSGQQSSFSGQPQAQQSYQHGQVGYQQGQGSSGGCDCQGAQVGAGQTGSGSAQGSSGGFQPDNTGQGMTGASGDPSTDTSNKSDFMRARAEQELFIKKAECTTLKHTNPQAYEQCAQDLSSYQQDTGDRKVM